MMRVKDIVKINGVWVYHIREDGEYGNEETKVKAPYSERILPLFLCYNRYSWFYKICSENG